MNDVLHVLDHSLPEHDGYSFRSHSILTNQLNADLSIKVLTGPKQGVSESNCEEIDGVSYQRTMVDANTNTSGVLGQIETVRRTRKSIAATLRETSARVIQAHSPCLNGLAAMGHGRPLVYEMRSSWEDAAVSVGSTSEGSMRYRLSRMLETYVAKRADAVVVICDGLKRELASRGVNSDKVTVIPNALPESMFLLPDRANISKVRERYQLKGQKVIGFFGSFFEWEGLDCLLRAMPAVLEAIPNAKLFIAGGGRQERELEALADTLNLGDRALFAGRVPHDQITACYAAADVMAYPRLPDRLTNMVTPLKPLEAMAQGTAVVASDVGGHKELISDEETGLLFAAGSESDLSRRLIEALSDDAKTGSITQRAGEFVRREKRWNVVVEKYRPVYDSLLGIRN